MVSFFCSRPLKQAQIFRSFTIDSMTSNVQKKISHVLEDLKQAEVTFSGTFAKLRKAAISFVMSSCMSVCLSVSPSVCVSVGPHGKTRLPLDGFSLKLTF